MVIVYLIIVRIVRTEYIVRSKTSFAAHGCFADVDIPSPLSPPLTFASLGFCCGASASRKRVCSVGDAVDKGWGFVCSTFSFLYFFAGDVSLPPSRTSKKRRSRCIPTGDRSLPSLSACRKRLQDHPEFPIRTSFRAVLFCAKVIKYYLWPQYEPKIHR